MGEVEERLLDITSDEAEESEQTQDAKKPNHSTSKSLDSYLVHFKWWIELAIYTFLSLGGQAGATLLGKVYFDQGGSSKWLVATLQTAGFPFLLPFLLLSSSKKIPNQNTKNNNFPILALVYTFLGLLLAAGGVFYSVGIEYLSAATYSLLVSTQLAFTAVLALFVNGQKFTPFILNSVVLLTFSPILLVFEKDDDDDDGADDNFMLGALFTVGTAASFALLFSLTELAFEKLIRIDVGSYQAIQKLTSKVDVGSYQDLQQKFIGGDVRSYQDLQQKFTGVEVGSHQDLQQKFIGADAGSYQDLQQKFTGVDVESYQDLQKKLTSRVDVGSYQDLQQKFTGVNVGSYQAMQKKLTSRVDVRSHQAIQKFTGVDMRSYEAMMETIKMTLWQSVVATVVTFVGLLWSGEWRDLRGEMEGYKQGIVSYFLNVVGTAVSCQAYYVGSIALTFKVSSLFSNVVIRLATPIVPFLSVVFLHEEMSGLKVTALLLSVWGFASYIYQQYLDENHSNEDIK